MESNNSGLNLSNNKNDYLNNESKITPIHYHRLSTSFMTNNIIEQKLSYLQINLAQDRTEEILANLLSSTNNSTNIINKTKGFFKLYRFII